MFVHDEFGNLVFVPRSLCFAEGEEGASGGGSEGGADGAAEGAGEGRAAEGAGEGKGKEGAAGGAEGDGASGKGQEGSGEQVADWRTGLTDPDLKKFADRSPDLAHLVKRAKEANDRMSKAIIPPGKDASEEDVAAYRKQIGVPPAPDGYKFEMPEGAEPTENDQAFHSTMAETFHALNITKDQAVGLNQAWNEITEAAKEAQAEADTAYAEESTEALRRSWGKDFEANKVFAQRAAEQMFGDEFEDARRLETKDGHFIMDHPVMLKALATIGREMAEGSAVPRLDGEAKEQAQDQLRELQDRINKAQENKDHKLADRLYQQKLALTAKVTGSRPIVGTPGRAV